jgi:transcription initiation factor TFIID TATA-box-binding protein
MEAIQTHPTNPAQAKAFTAPGSLSFPTGAQEMAGEGDKRNGYKPAVNGSVINGTGVNPMNPVTPAATPAANPGTSGLTPTLQ